MSTNMKGRTSTDVKMRISLFSHTGDASETKDRKRISIEGSDTIAVDKKIDFYENLSRASLDISKARTSGDRSLRIARAQKNEEEFQQWKEEITSKYEKKLASLELVMAENCRVRASLKKFEEGFQAEVLQKENLLQRNQMLEETIRNLKSQLTESDHQEQLRLAERKVLEESNAKLTCQLEWEAIETRIRDEVGKKLVEEKELQINKLQAHVNSLELALIEKDGLLQGDEKKRKRKRWIFHS
jgi:hypothetical protein